MSPIAGVSNVIKTPDDASAAGASGPITSARFLGPAVPMSCSTSLSNIITADPNNDLTTSVNITPTAHVPCVLFGIINVRTDRTIGLGSGYTGWVGGYPNAGGTGCAVEYKTVADPSGAYAVNGTTTAYWSLTALALQTAATAPLQVGAGAGQSPDVINITLASPPTPGNILLWSCSSNTFSNNYPPVWGGHSAGFGWTLVLNHFGSGSAGEAMNTWARCVQPGDPQLYSETSGGANRAIVLQEWNITAGTLTTQSVPNATPTQVALGVTDWSSVNGLSLNTDGSLQFGSGAPGRYWITGFAQLTSPSVPMSVSLSVATHDLYDVVTETANRPSTGNSNLLQTGLPLGAHELNLYDTVALVATQYSGSTQTLAAAGLNLIRITSVPASLLLSARIYANANNAGLYSAQNVTTFAAARWNIGGIWKASTPTRLTAPKTGIYHIGCMVWQVSYATSWADMVMWMRLNGTTIIDYHHFHQSYSRPGPYGTITLELSLNAGDYIEVLVSQSPNWTQRTYQAEMWMESTA